MCCQAIASYINRPIGFATPFGHLFLPRRTRRNNPPIMAFGLLEKETRMKVYQYDGPGVAEAVSAEIRHTIQNLLTRIPTYHNTDGLDKEGRDVPACGTDGYSVTNRRRCRPTRADDL